MRKRIEYPRMLYGPGAESHKVVNNAQQEQAARAQGFGTWHEAMAPAPEPEAPPVPVEGTATPTDEQWNDVQKLLAYGRSIGMKLGVKYKLETLQDKVTKFMAGEA